MDDQAPSGRAFPAPRLPADPGPDAEDLKRRVCDTAARCAPVIRRAVETVARARATREALAKARAGRVPASRPPFPATAWWSVPQRTGGLIPVAADPFVGLTPRQRQVLDLLLRGDSEKQVARALNLSKHTVHLYVTAVYRHFDVHSRAELLARFLYPVDKAS